MLDFLRKLFLFFLVVATLIGGGAAYLVHQMFIYQNPEVVRVKIDKGSSIKTIAYRLEENHVVHNRFIFEAYARFTKKGAKFKSGEYEFPAGLILKEVADQIAKGDVILYKLTIPEGYNIKDVCRLLEKEKLTTFLECQRLVRNVEILPQKTPDTHTLEGYLFPETYLYDSDTTAEGLIKNMAQTFFEQVDATEIQRALDKGYTLNEWVTLASVIEKETGQAGERPLIASVFLNRLKIGMPLQSDPTVIYGVPDFDGNLTRTHLTTDTPYNTYTRGGIPYGPICNPGQGSLSAVLNPATSEYLYFVAKGDGTHYFSKTLEEHNQAVQRFQIKRNSP